MKKFNKRSMIHIMCWSLSSLFIYMCCGHFYFSNRKTEKSPSIHFNMPAIIGGTKSEVVHTFKVTNPFKVPVDFIELSATCVCISKNITKMHLKPGESAYLTLVVGIPKTTSDRLVKCTVKTTNPSVPNWVYSLRIRTFSEMNISPSIISFNEKVNNTERYIDQTAIISMYQLRDTPLRCTIQPIVPPALRLNIVVDANPTVESIEDGVYRVLYKVNIRKDVADGATSDARHQIRFVRSDGQEISCIVDIKKQEPYIISPAFVHFNIQPNQKSHEYLVMVSSVDHKKFSLTKVSEASKQIQINSISKGENQSDWFDINERDEEGNYLPLGHVIAERHVLILKLRTSKLRESSDFVFAGELRVATESASEPPLRLPWTVLVAQPPQGTSSR